jgi:ketosteroid isomerase-like protein
MSQRATDERVELLRTIFGAFNRRDFDAALEHVHPEVELRPALQELDVDSLYSGPDELRRFMETVTNAWEEYLVEPVETTAAPGDRVLVVEHWHARGRDGIEFDFELIDVYSFRDGLVVRIDGYRDRSEARAGAGLPPA